MLDVCPCLTRSRAGSGGYWMTWKNRFMNTQEILRLMGVLNIHEMEGVVSTTISSTDCRQRNPHSFGCSSAAIHAELSQPIIAINVAVAY